MKKPASVILIEHDKRGNPRTHHIPQRYVPKSLTRTQKKKQLSYLKKSRSLYKKGIYYTRPKVSQRKTKKSNHVAKAKKMYSVISLTPTPELAKKTQCSMEGLTQIVKKGEGAYFSSGSRPGQTPFSWGIARLGSALTGGPSSIIDYDILKNHCSKKSKALTLANKTCKKNKKCNI